MCSGYLLNVLNTSILKRIVENTSEFITSQNIDFDSIAARGLSGTLVSSPVCIAINKNLVVVRKGESSHGYSVEAAVCPERYIIIDDFLDTGATIKAIIDRISSTHHEAKCVGVVLYQQYVNDMASNCIAFFDTSSIDDAHIAKQIEDVSYRIRTTDYDDSLPIKVTVCKKSYIKVANHDD